MMILARQIIPIQFCIPQADLGTNINSHEKQKTRLSSRIVRPGKVIKKGESTPINHKTVFRDPPIDRCQIFIVTIFPGSGKAHRRWICF